MVVRFLCEKAILLGKKMKARSCVISHIGVSSLLFTDARYIRFTCGTRHSEVFSECPVSAPAGDC